MHVYPVLYNPCYLFIVYAYLIDNYKLLGYYIELRNPPLREILNLCKDVYKNTYKSKKVKQLFIHKPSGNIKSIRVFYARDKLIQQSVLIFLMPLFTTSSCNSFFISDLQKNCHETLRKFYYTTISRA